MYETYPPPRSTQQLTVVEDSPDPGSAEDSSAAQFPVINIGFVYSTWDDAAQAAVEIIFSQVRKRSKVTLSDIRSEFDWFDKSLFSAPGGQLTAQAHFSALGGNAIELAAKRSQQLTVAEVTDVLVKKQRDYGPENIRRFGRQGILIRMHDKIARLENLLATGATPNNESIADTFLDIIGYSAIGIMWESGTFLLPLRKTA